MDQGGYAKKKSCDISDQRKVICLLANFVVTAGKASEVDRSRNTGFSKSMLDYYLGF
jgi:hypothetical protein